MDRSTLTRVTPIYHITHLRNLRAILEAGGLMAYSVLAGRNIPHVNIAHQTIQDRRAATRLPSAARRRIARLRAVLLRAALADALQHPQRQRGRL